MSLGSQRTVSGTKVIIPKATIIARTNGNVSRMIVRNGAPEIAEVMNKSSP